MLVVVSNPLGGIRTYLLDNLPHLQECGYAFTFAVPRGEAFDRFKHDVQHWANVEFVDVPMNGRNYSFQHTVRHTVAHNNILIVHSQGLRAGAEVSRALAIRRIPQLITLHDTINPHNRIPGHFR